MDARMSPSCLVTVSIDVECDKDEDWRVRRPLGFRGVDEGIGGSLAPLFREYGARPTYLLSPEVMQHEPSAALLGQLGGCELGAHLHPEFLDGSHGFAATSAVACQAPPQVERDLLVQLTSLFKDTFGSAPVSYRAGRYGASGRSLGFLAELGYAVDTSVTPGKLWNYGLDFRTAPSVPYYPDEADITRSLQTGRVLEIPVSLRQSPAPAPVRELAGRLSESRYRLVRRFAHRARGPFWFRPGWSSRGELVRFVRAASRGGYGGVLNMMFHNVDMVQGCSPSAASGAQVRSALDDLRAVLEETLAAGGAFATLAEIAEWKRSRG